MKKLLLSLALVFPIAGAHAETLEEVITSDCFAEFKDVNYNVTNYKDVEYTSATTGITYKGNLAKASSPNGGGMQFRSTNSNSGLVTTANPAGAKIIQVVVVASTKPSTSNQYDVYGSTSVYTAATQLYSEESRGTLIGSGKKVETLTSTDGFTAFGFRANKNAIYIDKITITYEVGDDVKKTAGLEFSESEVTAVIGKDFTAPTLTKDTTAAVVYSSSDEDIAEVNENTGAVEIKAVGTVTITASTEENDEFYPGSASYTINVINEVKASLVTTMSNGKFVIVTPEGVAKNYIGASSNAYGYLMIDTNIKGENDEMEVNENYLITFTNTDKGYTMVDCRGKYLGMDASHSGSFNFYATADAEGSNCYWTVTFEGNDARIENAGREGAFISYKQYNNDWELATVVDDTTQPLVQLYKSASSGVEGVIVDNNKENSKAEYFNLQGVRVEEPANGLYIVRRGDKVSKEIVR